MDILNQEINKFQTAVSEETDKRKKFQVIECNHIICSSVRFSNPGILGQQNVGLLSGCLDVVRLLLFFISDRPLPKNARLRSVYLHVSAHARRARTAGAVGGGAFDGEKTFGAVGRAEKS